MKRLLFIVQRPGDRLGHLDQLAAYANHQIERCYPSAGDTLPQSLGSYDAVIIGGGSMSANDEQRPAIQAQLEWIPRVLDSKIPLLGICLGGQLLARALGATVAKHPDSHVDIGYVPIRSTLAGDRIFPQHFYTYHWNQEGFDLPSGATRLAEGDVFPNQAFRYGRAYGFQFHPEITLDMIQQWNQRSGHMLDRPGAQGIESQLTLHQQHSAFVQHWLHAFLTQHLL